MKAYSGSLLSVLLLVMLLAIYYYLGPRVCLFATVLAAIWFGITLVLLTRPPGIPEFVSEEVGSDEQHVIRKDVVPKLPLVDRVRIAVAAACGSCFLLWVSLTLLAQ